MSLKPYFLLTSWRERRIVRHRHLDGSRSESPARFIKYPQNALYHDLLTCKCVECFVEMSKRYADEDCAEVLTITSENPIDVSFEKPGSQDPSDELLGCMIRAPIVKMENDAIHTAHRCDCTDCREDLTLRNEALRRLGKAPIIPTYHQPKQKPPSRSLLSTPIQNSGRSCSVSLSFER